MRLGGGLPRNGGAPIPCGGGVPCGGGSAPRNGGGVPANGGGPPWLHRSPGAREGNTFSSIDPPPRAEWGSHLDPAARLLSNTALPLPADRRGAPARWDGFVFDFPPHFRHCAPPLSSPAGTNVHPTPLHSVHSGHISTLFAEEMRVLRAILVAVAITAPLSSCVIYRSYDREVSVWNARSSEPARHGEFRYGHATPVPHFPRNPDPVVATLDERGTALVRLPGAFGWIRYGEDSTLIEGSQIRDGGTFELSAPRMSASDSRTSPWKVTISKPSE